MGSGWRLQLGLGSDYSACRSPRTIDSVRVRVSFMYTPMAVENPSERTGRKRKALATWRSSMYGLGP
eukprot:1346205-Amorphochlora_amoeboformis.AAC.1